VDQLLDARGDTLGAGAAPPAASRRASETVQVRGRIVVELQCASQGVEHLFGGMLVATLLQAHVVVGADAGEQRHL
jgi:hypothetical protein